MSTRKPKHSFTYAIEPPALWLQVAAANIERDAAILCRTKWQCLRAPVGESIRIPLPTRFH